MSVIECYGDATFLMFVQDGRRLQLFYDGRDGTGRPAYSATYSDTGGSLIGAHGLHADGYSALVGADDISVRGYEGEFEDRKHGVCLTVGNGWLAFSNAGETGLKAQQALRAWIRVNETQAQA